MVDVRKGKPEDLSENGIEVDPEDRTATPYYVEARFENRGSRAVGAHTLSVGIEDSDGNTFGELIVFGTGDEPFGPCPDEPERALDPGERVETCTLVLVPEGLDAARVYFLSDKGADEPPEYVYWTTG